MASPPKRIVIASGDKRVQLIKKLIEKTSQKKLVWVRSASAFSTSAPGMDFSFVLNAPIPILSYSRDWVLFTVRDQGKEILKIEHTGGDVPSIIAGLLGARDELIGSVNELFALVNGVAQGEIEKVIDKLDRI